MDIKTKRNELGISQYRLSLKSGVARFKLSNHEQGYVKLSQSDHKKVEKTLVKLSAELKGNIGGEI
jgi:predicted transcriptional regulator